MQQSHVQTHGARSLRCGGAGRQAARGDPSLVRDAIISWLRMHEETIAAGFVFPSLARHLRRSRRARSALNIWFAASRGFRRVASRRSSRRPCRVDRRLRRAPRSFAHAVCAARPRDPLGSDRAPAAPRANPPNRAAPRAFTSWPRLSTPRRPAALITSSRPRPWSSSASSRSRRRRRSRGPDTEARPRRDPGRRRDPARFLITKLPEGTGPMGLAAPRPPR